MTGILVRRGGDTETQTRGEQAGESEADSTGVCLQATGRQRSQTDAEGRGEAGTRFSCSLGRHEPCPHRDLDVWPPEGGMKFCRANG